MQLLETVKQTVGIRVAGALPALIDSEARWVIDEFLRDTRLYEKDYDVTLVAGTASYTLAIQDYESAWLLKEVWHNERPVRLGRPPKVYTATGSPGIVALTNDRTLLVYPIPDANAVLHVLKVTVCLTLLPSVFSPMPAVLRPYHAALVDGALTRMYSMPDKPWTNLKLAGVHLAAFNDAKLTVRREIDRGRAHGGQFVTFPRHLF